MPKEVDKENIPGPPKRPLSAFFLFKQDLYVKVKAENPEAKMTDLTKIISVKWNNIDPSTKGQYEKKQQQEKSKYEKSIQEFEEKYGKIEKKKKKSSGKEEKTSKKLKYLEDSERDAIFQTLKSQPENKKCMDCNKKNPSWASVYLGLFICYDCAGKHRQLGVPISFVRSLDLDKWNKRQITFMEIGGNASAQSFFLKNGMTAPFDYKSPVVDKYKKDQTKRVDTMLASPITSPKTEEKAQSPVAPVVTFEKQNSSSDATPKSDTTFDNVKINKEQTKTKGFTVEFSKSKSVNNGKTRIAAKRIGNIDLDALTLEDENFVTMPKPDYSAVSSMEAVVEPVVVEEVAEVKTTVVKPVNYDEKFKKFSSAKSISSDSFRDNDENRDPNADFKRFGNANSISSSQYHGNASKASGIDVAQTMENAKDFFSSVGGKMSSIGGSLKEKAGGSLGTVKGSLGNMFTKIKWGNKEATAVPAEAKDTSN